MSAPVGGSAAPLVVGPLVVVAGVSGTGKSTVGRLLADGLGVDFVDGDDLHSDEEVATMSSGHPLTEAQRAPWLDRVGRALADHDHDGVVVACSALRRDHRDRLRRWAPRLDVVLLDGDHDLIAHRQADRPGHFMPAGLMGSQFATLEPLGADESGLRADVAAEPARIVADYLARERARRPGSVGGQA